MQSAFPAFAWRMKKRNRVLKKLIFLGDKKQKWRFGQITLQANRKLSFLLAEYNSLKKTQSFFLSDPSPIIGNACHSLTHSLTHWLTDSLLFSQLDWCDVRLVKMPTQNLLRLIILMWQLNLPTNIYKSSNNKKYQQISTNLPTI